MPRYHKLHETWRRKAIEQQEKEDQQLFAIKRKGQWILMRSMAGKGHVKALTALRRSVKGPRGQPKDSIMTGPEEILAIIRATQGKIYDGNAKDQEKLKDEYFEEYKEFIFNGIEAEAEKITGKDLGETMRGAKETATGLDQ